MSVWQTVRNSVLFTPPPTSRSVLLVGGLELAVVGVFIWKILSNTINQGFSPLGCWFINIHQQGIQFFLIYISFGYHVAKEKNISVSLSCRFIFIAYIFKCWAPGMSLQVRLFPFLSHSLSFLPSPLRNLGFSGVSSAAPGCCRLGAEAVSDTRWQKQEKKSELDCNCAAVVDSIKAR